jgi:hypothetical protein
VLVILNNLLFLILSLQQEILHNLAPCLADGEGTGEYNPGDSKRTKGLGIGGPDGPVSLDDVRRLQRSNEVI